VSRHEEPQDRLGRIANRVLEAVDELGEEVRDVRTIVLLTTNISGHPQGGAATLGYDIDDSALLVRDLLAHAKGLIEQSGIGCTLTVKTEEVDGTQAGQAAADQAGEADQDGARDH
jgi:hypothetical protein